MQVLRLRQLQISLRTALQAAASQAAAEQSRADGLAAELEAERALNRHYVQEVRTHLWPSPLPHLALQWLALLSYTWKVAGKEGDLC